MVSYSRDWTSPHLDFWGDVLSSYMEERPSSAIRGNHPVYMLEIGCYEGQSTGWFLQNILTDPKDRIWCVDPHLFEPETSEQRFWETILATNSVHKVIKQKQLSASAVPNYGDSMFDIIYIDGNHEGEYVLQDALNCFPKCKSGGIMIFDDYYMPVEYHNEELNLHWVHMNSVEAAVNIFLDFFKDRIEVVGIDKKDQSSQIAIRKL